MKARHIAFVSVFVVASIAGQAGAGEVDKDKLRELAQMPQFAMTFGIGWTTTQGFTGFRRATFLDVDSLASCFGGAETNPTNLAENILKTMKNNASDVERWLRLGNVYSDAKQSALAGEAYTNALNLCRQQLESHPRDARTMTQYGRSLMCVGELDLAESVLRRAVKIAPKDWACWSELGGCLADRAMVALIGKSTYSDDIDYMQSVNEATKNRPSKVRITKARKLLGEAARDYDEAVAVAPHEPEAYLQRWAFRAFSRAFVEKGLIDGKADWFTRGISSPEALSDLWQAAHLLPKNLEAINLAVFMEFASIGLRSGKGFEEEGSAWRQFPKGSKRQVEWAMGRLQAIAVSEDKKPAASALESLGLFQKILQGDSGAAEQTLRRAVALDASREQSWDMLVTILATNRVDELVSVCEQRLKVKDCARNRLLLAKSYMYVHEPDKAEEQVDVALASEPNDSVANLAKAALLLRRGDDAQTLARARELTVKAAWALGESPTDEQRIEAYLMMAIQEGLAGDHDEAQAYAQKALAVDSENQRAKEVLKALGL